MKRKKHYKTVFIKTTIVAATLMSATSCFDNTKPEDTKVVAETQNEHLYRSTKAENDVQFIVNVAGINLNEIQLAQLAQGKSENTDVQNFGKMVETDHQASLKEITAIADKKKIIIPTSLTDDGKNDFKQLTNLSNVDFDKQYTTLMVKEHQDAITLFDKAATESEDPELKKIAIATLPKLHAHLEMAIILKEKYTNKK
jgi:putative membrane protein